MPPKRKAKKKKEEPFEIGFHLYIAPFYLVNNPGSTRLVCSAYHFRVKESPLTGQLYLERNKVIAEAQKDETKMKFSVKYLLKNIDNRGTLLKQFEEDVDSPFEANVVTGLKGMKFKADTKVIIKLANEKDRELIARDIITGVFRDLIKDTNTIVSLIDSLVEVTEVEDIVYLIQELQKGDLDIYSEYEEPIDEEIEDSNQRMYSRAVAMYTAYSVTKIDVPEDDEIVTLNPSVFSELELHEIALLAAILHVREL